MQPGWAVEGDVGGVAGRCRWVPTLPWAGLGRGEGATVGGGGKRGEPGGSGRRRYGCGGM